jgi:hypothetical protein
MQLFHRMRINGFKLQIFRDELLPMLKAEPMEESHKKAQKARREKELLKTPAHGK